MSNIIKYVVYALIFTFILGGLLFAGILSLLPWAITDAKVAIEFMPVEYRFALFIIFAGLILWLGKSFFN
jgi:hypothetical protein